MLSVVLDCLVFKGDYLVIKGGPNPGLRHMAMDLCPASRTTHSEKSSLTARPSETVVDGFVSTLPRAWTVDAQQTKLKKEKKP
jgi:hypothetical protein